MKLSPNFQQLLIFVIALVACLTSAHEVDNEREFSYEEKSKNGPAHWGEIHPEWKKCNSGKMQSPIDLLNRRVKLVSHLGPINATYMPADATLMNRGHDMMVSWPSGAGNVEINGRVYQLTQAHWHSPSEHTINGRRLDMELHLVHQTNDDRTAVIAILYKIGQPDSFISMMKHKLEALDDTRDIEKDVGIIDPNLIKYNCRSYYRYKGSLTTPPCTEGVIWTIVKRVRTVSKEQVELIRRAVHDKSEANARPIQPTNKRIVKLYKPTYREN